MPLGRIAKFFEDRGYGFIKPDDGGPDVFFNMKEVTQLSWGTTPRAPTRMSLHPQCEVPLILHCNWLNPHAPVTDGLVLGKFQTAVKARSAVKRSYSACGAVFCRE
jgi:hypothetical protein